MKILIFEQRYTNAAEAGIGRFNAFAGEWARAGHQVTVVAGMLNYFSGEKPRQYAWKLFAKEKEPSGAGVIRVMDATLGYRTFLGRLWSYFSFFILALIAGLSLKKPDVVIASSPPIFIGFLGWLVATLKKAPFIFEIRDLWPDEAIELGFLKNKILIKFSFWLEKFLYRKANFLVVNSPGIKEFLIVEKSVASEKIAIIPNPVDLTLFDGVKDFSLREKMGWSDKTVVLYIGAMSAVYDLDSILSAAQNIADLPIVFVLVGNGRQKAALVERQKRMGLTNVVFLDAVPKQKVPEFIAASDICVAPLRNLSLLKYIYATKIFDYMAGGRPIVLSMVGVSADVVCRDAKSGICLNPEDRNGFKEAIIELYKNKTKREKLGKAGRQYVLKNFNIEDLAKDYLGLLRNTKINTNIRKSG